MAVRTTKPGRGPIASTGINVVRRSERTARRDGTWRPNVPFAAHTGLLIQMRHEKGVTNPGLLRSPFRFQVPVTDEFRRSFRHSWGRSKTLAGGERLRDEDRELFELPVSTMFLDQIAQDGARGLVAFPYTPYPQEMIDELVRIMGGRRGDGRDVGTPFRLVISQPQVWDDPLVNLVCVMTQFDAVQPAGETGVERVSATFVEYPEDEIDRNRRPRADEQKRKVDPAEDDSLQTIAKAKYQQASLWRPIAKANGIRGVSSSSAAQLSAWMKRNHKKTLVIPPRPKRA